MGMAEKSLLGKHTERRLQDPGWFPEGPQHLMVGEKRRRHEDIKGAQDKHKAKQEGLPESVVVAETRGDSIRSEWSAVSHRLPGLSQITKKYPLI